MTPKNWPKKFFYSPESIGIDQHIALLRFALASDRPEDLERVSPCIEEKRVHPELEIRKITARLAYKGPRPHPLVHSPDGMQVGGFARGKIREGEELGEYVGKIRLGGLQSGDEEKERFFNWVVKAKNGNFWCIDSNTVANELMFVNDFRGLKEAPNAGIKWIVHRGFYYFGYAALRDIEAGEEIVVDYGQSWAKIHQEKYPNLYQSSPAGAPGQRGFRLPG